MCALHLIANHVINVSPSLTAIEVLAAVHHAKVKKLRKGCVLVIKFRKPDFGITPDVVMQFDDQSRVVAVTWSHVFDDIEAALKAFVVIEGLIKSHATEGPSRRVIAGSKKVRSHFECSWRRSHCQRLTLQVVQPKARDLRREVILTHDFRQPEASNAAHVAAPCNAEVAI